MSHVNSEINHDQSEPDSRLVGWWTVFFVLLLIVIALFAILFYKGSIATALNQSQRTPQSAELTKLRIYEKSQLKNLEAAKKKIIESYR